MKNKEIIEKYIFEKSYVKYKFRKKPNKLSIKNKSHRRDSKTIMNDGLLNLHPLMVHTE